MSKSSKSDAEQFRAAMQNVRPLKADERHYPTAPKKRSRISQKLLAMPDADAPAKFSSSKNLLAQVADACENSRSLCRDELPRKSLRMLGSAQLPAADSFDLHGLTENQARQALQQFITSSLRDGRRCVRVVHGKGLRSEGPAVLRLMSWQQLWQNPAVLALKPCVPKDGGTGAVLVLLKSPGCDLE